MWSIGCVLYELFQGSPLFGGGDVKAIVDEIVDTYGWPDQAWMGQFPTKFLERMPPFSTKKV
jgi:hypothetical protein